MSCRLILILLLLTPVAAHPQTWQEAMDTKSGELAIYWYTSWPFIYENEEGKVEGLEADLLRAFADYLKDKHGVDLQLKWIKTDDFAQILEIVRKGDQPNAVGVSALSITNERKKYARFADPYLADITVLVSSKGTPIVRSLEEINDMMKTMTAVTIKATKYEALLEDVKEKLNVDFKTIYIESDQNVMSHVSEASDRFGFIDLPIYLMRVKSGGELVRQNFFTVNGQGYSFILPLQSDWDKAINLFINDPNNKELISAIVTQYLGEELSHFLDNIYSGDQITTSILTKEKELQLDLIKNANLKLEKEQQLRKALIAGISVTSALLIVIGYLFYRNERATRELVLQKNKIEVQQEDITEKHEQLINRNTQLITLNEEKNNLIKILAHDIRSPLSQIIMITEILTNPSEEALDKRKELLNQVAVSAHRINQMVAKILDIDSAENRAIKVMHERVDVKEILSEIKARYSSRAASKDISLEVIPCSNNHIIRSDNLLLTLVMENLVSNAIKFSPKGSCVRLESICKYDSVVFKVSDEGPGFTEEDKKLLFNRFQKLSAKPTDGEPSIGLGLSIVKKYVNDLGGQVWLESEKGSGSTFFVKLSI